MKPSKKKRGFTLVELLIVIAISGVLMAMSAPKYGGIVDKANVMEQRAHVREALNHIDLYNLDVVDGIKDTEVFNAVSGPGKEFQDASAKVHAGYKTCTVGTLRRFADGETITISEAPSGD